MSYGVMESEFFILRLFFRYESCCHVVYATFGSRLMAENVRRNETKIYANPG